MAIERPTLQEIRDRQEADLLAALGANEFRLGSYLKALSDSLAATANELYGYIQGYQAKQGCPLTAEGQYLQDWAEVVDFSRNAATYAHGDIDFTGTEGALIPAGTELLGSNSVTYRSTESVILDEEGEGTANVIALVPGVAANLIAGSSLTIMQPIESVSSTATVAETGIAGGIDQESDDSLRSKILGFLRNRPQGGALADYYIWVSEVAGTGKTWVFPLVSGASTVDIYFLTDDDDDIVPGTELVQAVQTYIDNEHRRPVTVTVYVRTVTTVDQDFEISLVADDNADLTEVKLAVEANLKDLIRRERKPGGILLVSKIREAVSNAAGEYDNVVVAPDEDVEYDTGEIPVFGAIEWTE